ncbi:hypothetical protein NPIL_219521, partial [Nephila pilipes]
MCKTLLNFQKKRKNLYLCSRQNPALAEEKERA